MSISFYSFGSIPVDNPDWLTSQTKKIYYRIFDRIKKINGANFEWNTARNNEASKTSNHIVFVFLCLTYFT